ncbi:PH domain-containing protein [Gracilibacillus xinjiangensis]|uniref:PH domain-containing protein n=1 Tax=Gracilibacillus xinjiangensis TaxID=1193282 RepID=A0ABV8WS53_9BACI
MKFRAKRDQPFLLMILIAIVIIGIATILPIFLIPNPNLFDIILLIGIFGVCTGFSLWTTFDISYTLHDDYLFAKGGLFRSKIPYKDIIKIVPSTDILTGYRILSSRDGLEIFYKNSFFGSIKISPEDKNQFLEELEKRRAGNNTPTQ